MESQDRNSKRNLRLRREAHSIPEMKVFALRQELAQYMASTQRQIRIQELAHQQDQHGLSRLA